MSVITPRIVVVLRPRILFPDYHLCPLCDDFPRFLTSTAKTDGQVSLGSQIRPLFGCHFRKQSPEQAGTACLLLDFAAAQELALLKRSGCFTVRGHPFLRFLTEQRQQSGIPTNPV
jgi:hypothetical protein